MLTLYVKHEDLEERDGQTVNHGGRTIRSEESPTGEEIQPGETFQAPESWYDSRRHWHFLTVRSKTPERFRDNPTVVDELVRPERGDKDPEYTTEDEGMTYGDISAMGYRDLQGACKDLGLSAGGSTEVLRARLVEHFEIVEPDSEDEAGDEEE